MAKTIVPTIEDTTLADITTVKLVFSSVVITAATWPMVKSTLGEQLYVDGKDCVTMQETEETDQSEKTFEYNTTSSGVTGLSSINHILYFSGTGRDLSLQASHPLGSSELPLDNIKLLRLIVTMSDTGAASGKVCSNFLDDTISIVDVLLNYREHIYDGELFGLGGYKNINSPKSVHDYLYKTDRDGKTDVLTCTTIKSFLNFQSENQNILSSGSGSTPRKLYLNNLDSGESLFPVSRFGNDNRKYSYFLYFYYNRTDISNAVTAALRKVKIIGDSETYNLPEEVHLGFNDHSGAYLYLYDLNVNSSGYMLAVLIGCNANMRIDIYISRVAGMSDGDNAYTINLHNLPLRINHWYDRLYFVLPYFSNASVQEETESELDAKRLIYTVYPAQSPEAAAGSSRPAPALLGQSVHTINGHDYSAQIFGYYPYRDRNGNIIPESAAGNMDTRMERMFEDFEHIYMLDFSDMGDVLVNLEYDKDTKKFNQTFFNIFGDTAEQISKNMYAPAGEKSANRIFNRYNLEGRCLNSEGRTSSYDQCVLDSLGGLYTTTAAQLKYLIENNYIVIYAGSAFAIGYNQYHKNYLVLFKCNKDKATGHIIERIRRKISVPFSVCDEFLLHKDPENNVFSCEYVDGTVFRTPFTVESTEMTAESAESDKFCGIPVKDIIAASRHVIVVAEKDANNNITGAYRY